MRETKLEDQSWARKIQRYIALGQKSQALRLLDRAIEFDMPLFYEDTMVQEDRRLAWLYRIDLLREWGRLSEALAWTCLECELNPGNMAAQVLKESLKRKLHLQFTNKTGQPVPVRKKNVGLWDGVAGMREVKATLERDIILPLQEPELCKRFRLHMPRGILLYGPPGCGKTFIARKLAGVLKCSFMERRPSDLGSIYVHGGQLKIKALFDEAKRKAPTLLFLDEIDAFVPNREKLGSHHYAAEVNEFLEHLNDCWKEKILVIGATNRMEDIDPAVLRPGRMDKKIFIGPPDLEARVELVRLSMQGRPQEPIDWVGVGDRSEFCTGAELDYVVNEAARLAFESQRPIKEEDILLALDRNPPALNKTSIAIIKNPIGFLNKG